MSRRGKVLASESVDRFYEALRTIVLATAYSERQQNAIEAAKKLIECQCGNGAECGGKVCGYGGAL